MNSAAQPLIVVYVGADDNMTDFDIHKNVLVDKSPFFAAALVEAAGAETQGGTLTTYLEESDPAAFSHVVEWMCKDRVGLQEHGDLIKTYLDKKVEHHTTVHDWLGKGRPEDDVEDEAVYKRYVKDVMKELDDRALNYIGGLETGRLSQYA